MKWFSRTFINININSKKFHHSLKIQCLKIAEIREEYINLDANIKEAQEIIADGSDAEMVEMAKMQLEEVELVVEVNGKGQVSLLGTGGELGGKGAITLKFKRKTQ